MVRVVARAALAKAEARAVVEKEVEARAEAAMVVAATVEVTEEAVMAASTGAGAMAEATVGVETVARARAMSAARARAVRATTVAIKLTRPMARPHQGNAKRHSTPSHDDGVERQKMQSPGVAERTAMECCSSVSASTALDLAPFRRLLIAFLENRGMGIPRKVCDDERDSNS